MQRVKECVGEVGGEVGIVGVSGLLVRFGVIGKLSAAGVTQNAAGLAEEFGIVRVGGVKLPPVECLGRKVLGGGGNLFEQGNLGGCLGAVGRAEEERFS